MKTTSKVRNKTCGLFIFILMIPIMQSLSSCNSGSQSNDSKSIDSAAIATGYLKDHPNASTNESFSSNRKVSEMAQIQAVGFSAKGPILAKPDTVAITTTDATSFIRNYQNHKIDAKTLKNLAWLVEAKDITDIMSSNPEYIQIFLSRETTTSGAEVGLVLAGVSSKNGVPYNTVFTSSLGNSVIDHVIPCPDCKGVDRNGTPYLSPVQYDDIHTTSP